MKINKDSWHYRMVRWFAEVDFDSKLRCCSFDDSMMPQTICAYILKLASAIILVMTGVGVLILLALFLISALYIVIFMLVKEPEVILVGMSIIAAIIFLAYCVHVLPEMITMRILKPLKEWQDKHCQKVEYK